MGANTKSLNVVNQLLLLRGLAIINVVMGHANGWMVTAMFWWTHRYRPVTVPNYDQIGSFSYYALRVLEQLVIYVIPAFIFISGYFMARSAGDDQTVGWKVILKRVKRLLPPYILWSTVIIVLDLIQGKSVTPLEFVTKILSGSAIPEYYFPVLLIQFYLISPLIIPLARSKWKPLVITSGLIHIVLMIFRYLPLLGITISLPSFLAFFTKSQVFLIHLIWFSFGLVAYYHYDGLKAILERFKWLLLIGLISSFLIGIVEWEYIFQTSNEPWILYSYTIIDTIYTAFVILTFLAFAKAFTAGSKQLINIGSKSYGIYLIHPIVIMITARIIYHVLPRLLAYPLVFYAIIILVGISVPVLMMVLTTKTPLNRFYELAFGRR